MPLKHLPWIAALILLTFNACASKTSLVDNDAELQNELQRLTETINRLDTIQAQMAELENGRLETLNEIRVLQTHYENLEEQYRNMATDLRDWHVAQDRNASIIEDQQKAIQSLENEKLKIENREKHFKSEISTYLRTIRSQKRMLADQARKIQQQEEAIRELMKPRL